MHVASDRILRGFLRGEVNSIWRIAFDELDLSISLKPLHTLKHITNHIVRLRLLKHDLKTTFKLRTNYLRISTFHRSLLPTAKFLHNRLFFKLLQNFQRIIGSLIFPQLRNRFARVSQLQVPSYLTLAAIQQICSLAARPVRVFLLMQFINSFRECYAFMPDKILAIDVLHQLDFAAVHVIYIFPDDRRDSGQPELRRRRIAAPACQQPERGIHGNWLDDPLSPDGFYQLIKVSKLNSEPFPNDDFVQRKML